MNQHRGDGEAKVRDATRTARAADEPKTSPGKWVIRLVLALLFVALGFIAWQVFQSAVPRQWSHWVGARVDGSLLRGATWGLGIGFVFAFVPLVLFFQVRRGFLSWAWRGIVVLIALALATPNWLTLWVVLGSSRSTHAAERTFDVDAPWFQGGSAAGAIVGAVLAVALSGTSMWLKYRKNQVRDLQAELDQRRHRELKGDIEA